MSPTISTNNPSANGLRRHLRTRAGKIAPMEALGDIMRVGSESKNGNLRLIDWQAGARVEIPVAKTFAASAMRAPIRDVPFPN